MSTTLVRVLVILGSTLGAILGAVMGIAKLVPERTKLILESQLMVMESLREENKRQAEIIARSEVEIEDLRGQIQELREKVN